MAPSMLENDFCHHLRQLASYCVSLDDFNKINGHNIRSMKAEKNGIKDSINYFSEHLEFIEVNKDNFLEFCYLVYNAFNRFDISKMNLHLDKHNNCIFKLLTILVDSDTQIEGKRFNENQLNILHIIHSKLVSIFNKNGTSLVESLFNELVSKKLNGFVENINTSNINKNESYNKKGKLEEKYVSFNKYYDLITKNTNGIEIKRIYKRYLKYKNHLTIINIHLDKQTTPSQLFYIRFPHPFFIHEDNYINNYNEIIKKTQDDIMKLNSEFINDQISILKVQLETLKDSLKNDTSFNGVDLNDFMCFVEDFQENTLSNKFTISKNKAERCVVKKFDKEFLKKSFDHKRNNDVNSTKFSRTRKTSPSKSVSFNDSSISYSSNLTNVNQRPILRNYNDDERSNMSFNNGSFRNNNFNNGSYRYNNFNNGSNRNNNLNSGSYRDNNYNDFSYNGYNIKQNRSNLANHRTDLRNDNNYNNDGRLNFQRRIQPRQR